MSTTDLATAMRRLRRVAARQAGSSLSDAELVRRFVATRDEAAFEVLVWRHGGRVLGLCRHLLRAAHDAEDAFQATFLVFVRKAGGIGKRESVGSWLCKVAYRASLRLRALQARQLPTRDDLEVADSVSPSDHQPDLRPILDEEVQRLPERYRVPVVLCYLEGKTTQEAAEQLGRSRWTIGTQLARAKELLRKRLTRRGVTLSAGTVGVVLSQVVQEAASAATHAPLVVQTVDVAIRFVINPASVAGGPTARAAALATGVLKTMFFAKLHTAALAAVAFIGLTAGSFMLAQEKASDKPGQKPGASPATTAQESQKARPARADANPQEWKQRAAIELGGKASAYSLALSPDGKLIAVGSEGKIQLWTVEGGQHLADLEHQGTIWSLAFSPNGRVLASGSKAGTVMLWDVPSRLLKASSEGHADNVNSVAFSPDGKLLATGSFDKTVRLWDADTGKEVRRIVVGAGEATGVAFSPDGRTLAATTGMSKVVKLLEIETGKEVRTLAGHTDLVWCVAFSPDGRTLATGGRDTTVRLWEANTGKQKAVLKWHVGQVNAVAFSPDGRTLASAGGTNDHTVQLWDAATGKEIATLKEHTETVWCVRFAGNPPILITGGNDGVIRIWSAVK